MVSKLLKMKDMSTKNPFANMGEKIWGERFVGRKEKVEQIQQYCTSQNFSIVGMPIGKTSLAYHSVIENKEKVYSEKPLCTIFFDVDLYINNKDFFKYLVVKTYEALSEIIHEEKEEKMLNRFYSRRKDDNFELCTIPDFFNNLCALNVNVVIIFDEFDKVLDIGFTKNDFAILRNILHSKNTKGITISRRPIRILEYKNDDTAGSNFFQTFQGSTISLKGFDNESLDEYWRRLIPYFRDKKLEINDSYKDKANFYVGKHPRLLDVYNSTIYNTPFDYKTDVRNEMNKAFDYVIKILDESELLNTAIQAILGPLYNVELEKIDQLVSYDFLKKVSIKEKEDLLGGNYGYVAEDESSNKYSYIAFSDYFTLLMRNKFINNFDFWQEWTGTLLALRKLIEQFLKDNWGEEWEKNANLDKDLKDKLYDFREKDIRANITPSPLIAYLTESLIYNIISKYWDSTFERVFTPWNSNDFNTRISFILKIRNHYAHINAGSFSNTDISQTNLYLKETLDKLTTWFEKNENLKIKSIPIPLAKGEVIENNKGKKQIKCDNGKLYSVKQPEITLNIGDRVEFEIGKEPNKYFESKIYYYAKNIKTINS